MIKYLVTSGCSFSDNCFNDGLQRWPQMLAKELDLKLFNYGQGSSGNDWICDSTIYGVQKLLNLGILPEEILVIVMWSAIDRYGLFISEKETLDFNNYINTNDSMNNPVHFVNFTPNVGLNNAKLSSGWLIGSPTCVFYNKNISEKKVNHYINFECDEHLAFKSYNYFLTLQWFCKANNIQLLNMTYKNIFHYPYGKHGLEKMLMYETWPENLTHLHNMIDFKNWLFVNEWDGLWEYTKDNKLEFMPGDTHPHPMAHKHFVDNVLKQIVSNKLRIENIT